MTGSSEPRGRVTVERDGATGVWSVYIEQPGRDLERYEVGGLSDARTDATILAEHLGLPFDDPGPAAR